MYKYNTNTNTNENTNKIVSLNMNTNIVWEKILDCIRVLIRTNNYGKSDCTWDIVFEIWDGIIGIWDSWCYFVWIFNPALSISSVVA